MCTCPPYVAHSHLLKNTCMLPWHLPQNGTSQLLVRNTLTNIKALNRQQMRYKKKKETAQNVHTNTHTPLKSNAFRANTSMCAAVTHNWFPPKRMYTGECNKATLLQQGLTHTCVHVSSYIHTCVCMHICVRGWVNECVYVYVCERVSVCVCVCMCMCMRESECQRSRYVI